MAVWLQSVMCLVLLAHVDLPVSRWRPQPANSEALPPGVTLPVVPQADPKAQAAPGARKAGPQDRLQPLSRLEIVRYVSAEFARARRPLPAGKNGFRFTPGEPVNDTALRQAAATHGAAGNPGDLVQVTGVEFKDKEIFIHINGGGKRKTRWRDRIQVSVSGRPSVASSNATPGFQGLGSTLIVDFDRAVPDLTADELKEILSPFLDFSKGRSAAVQWIETLPPEFQQAIKERRAMVGMDREMVVAALGKPDRKVRERDEEGRDTEDWIYGVPPGQTIFVKLVGDKVVSVKQYPK